MLLKIEEHVGIFSLIKKYYNSSVYFAKALEKKVSISWT